VRLREVEVIGYRSVLDQLPGVKAKDVIAMRQRFDWRRLRWARPRVLIRDRRDVAWPLAPGGYLDPR
jgi:hypothetical protein